MVSALASGSSGSGSSPGRVFLGKALNSQCLSPPRCMGTGELAAEGNPAME